MQYSDGKPWAVRSVTSTTTFFHPQKRPKGCQLGRGVLVWTGRNPDPQIAIESIANVAQCHDGLSMGESRGDGMQY